MKDVIPPLKTNSDGLKQVLDELLKQYKAKQDELDGWKVCFFIFVFICGFVLWICFVLLFVLFLLLLFFFLSLLAVIEVETVIL